MLWPMRPVLLLCVLFAACAAPAAPIAAAAPERAAARVLDDLHRLASTADGEAYFELFAPGAVYIGTDAGERWSVGEFRAYAEPYFAQGRGWTYAVRERHLAVSADGRTVWFDERLDNASYGECRGSGVLVLGPDGWRIAQYVLSLPVPNALARDLVERIRALESGEGPVEGGGGL